MAIPFTMPSDPVDELIRIVLLIQQARLKRNRENHELLEEIIKFLLKELEKKLRCSDYDDQLREAIDMIRHGLDTFRLLPENRGRRIRTSDNYCDNKLDQVNVRQDCKRIGPIRRVPPTKGNHGTWDFTYPSFDVIEEEADYTVVERRETEEDKNLLLGVTCAIWRVICKPARKLFWTAVGVVPIICVVGWTLVDTSNDSM